MAILQMTINTKDRLTNYFFSSEETIGNWIVDWGDGTIEVNSEDHCYKEAGLYQITVKGDFIIEHLGFSANIVSLDKEEGCGITSSDWCFSQCNQLKSVPHNWDISKVDNMNHMFYGCKNFNQDLSHWNISHVEDKRYMFLGCCTEDKHKPRYIV